LSQASQISTTVDQPEEPDGVAVLEAICKEAAEDIV
jgi:hypothetical protein